MYTTQLEKLENLAQRYNKRKKELESLKPGSKGYYNVQNKLARIEHRLMSKFIHQMRIAELNGNTKLMTYLFEMLPEEIDTDVLK